MISCVSEHINTISKYSGNTTCGPLRWFVHDSDYTIAGSEKLKPKPAICGRIRSVLERFNPFWNKFRQLSEEPSEDARLELSVGEGRELAAIICSNRNDPLQTRSVVCYKSGSQQPMFINTYSSLYLPLHYVLMFAQGTLGWDLAWKIETGMTLSKYAKQFILRNKALKYLSGLCNEFPLDMFSAVTDQKLFFLRNHSSKICQKKELGVGNDNNPGKTFLPSSFPGSRRHQQDMISDALAIVGRFGNPTYFVTMTCNPKWPEIACRLKPGQSASDRPDVVNQVFKAKLQQLQQCLVKSLCGKRKIYKIHVIEFQKRGTATIRFSKTYGVLFDENSRKPSDNSSLTRLKPVHLIR